MKFSLPYMDGWVAYGRARREHAWILRAEGLEWKQIGKRLGTNASTARNLVQTMGKDVASAIENATWTFHNKEPVTMDWLRP